MLKLRTNWWAAFTRPISDSSLAACMRVWEAVDTNPTPSPTKTKVPKIQVSDPSRATNRPAAARDGTLSTAPSRMTADSLQWLNSRLNMKEPDVHPTLRKVIEKAANSTERPLVSCT